MGGDTDFSANRGRLSGKIALITGASRGIGAAVAECFAREGAHVVLAARTVGGLEEVDDRVRAARGSATLVPVDLRDF
ncbi:MAG: SDR family NAD(P)-dependent oxidoreductase, partial [Alphaproteobacteria bacterium]|nr:SDR family NAD(P)-dependent oxidoreductase [Alphaproteobacteria bacterium]